MLYKRILLKISGSFFSGQNDQGIDCHAVDEIAREVISLHQQTVEIAIVNGAGNIFRGRNRPANFDQVAADKIGYVSTLPNAMALAESLNRQGTDARLMCSFEIPSIARHFDVFKARQLLSQKKILVLAGGTGHPFFSTDTAAVLRALEIKADILLKATDVDGVYSADPRVDDKAVKYDNLTYQEALNRHLDIMDQPAFALARDNELKILVFKFEPGALLKILKNPNKGTLISN
ncbi:MAG: UMP kinase [Patescibacteria group bacterium]